MAKFQNHYTAKYKTTNQTLRPRTIISTWHISTAGLSLTLDLLSLHCVPSDCAHTAWPSRSCNWDCFERRHNCNQVTLHCPNSTTNWAKQSHALRGPRPSELPKATGLQCVWFVVNTVILHYHLILRPRPCQITPLCCSNSVLHLFAGRGRQMDAYVDDLFYPVLDQGPPVSDVIRFILLFKL